MNISSVFVCVFNVCIHCDVDILQSSDHLNNISPLDLPELEVDALHGGLGDHVPLAPGLCDGHGGGRGQGSLTNEKSVYSNDQSEVSIFAFTFLSMKPTLRALRTSS